MPCRKLDLVWVTVIFVAVLVVFGQTITFDMIDLDDAEHIVSNPFVASPSWASLKDLWVGPYFKLWIPMTYMAWAAIGALPRWLTSMGSIAPVALFHGANVLGHGLNSILVFSILRQVGLRPRAAGVAALLFALHPLQVESIAWISGFKDVFAGVLSLTAIFLWARFVHQRSLQYFWLSSLLFGAALLAKPTAASLPLVAAALTWGMGPDEERRRQMGHLVLWTVASFGVVFFTMTIQPATDLPFVVKPLDRLLIAADTLVFYGSQVLFPLRLGFDYGMTPDWVRQNRPTILALGIVFGCGLLLFYHPRWRRWRIPVVVFAGALLPTLGLIPYYYQAISTTADRYCYLAMLGPALGVGMMVEASGHKSWSRVAPPWGMGILVGLGLISFRQTTLWRETITISRHTLEVNPRSWLAHHILGGALVKAGDLEGGTRHLQKTTAMRPWFPDAYYNLAVVAKMRGDLAGARTFFQSALRYEPKDGQAWLDLAEIQMLLGQDREAIEAFDKALALRPLSGGYRDGALFANYGLAHLRLGHLEAAARALNKALALDPQAVMAQYNLGLVFEKQGQLDQAHRVWQQILAKNPDFVPAQKALERLGQDGSRRAIKGPRP